MIEDLAEFLLHAVQLEAEAAEGYAQLGERLEAAGNAPVAALFARLGEYSQLHLAEARERYRTHTGDEARVPAGRMRWPDHLSPERAAADLRDLTLDVRAAIERALALERRACDFYSAVANQTRNAQVQELAQAFAEEESAHVSHLERWLARAAADRDRAS